MSTIFESFAKTESAVYDNVDVNIAVNELAEIQHKSVTLQEALQFTPEMVPVVKLEGCDEGQAKYCIDNDCFKKMLDSQGLTVSDGIEKLFAEIEKDPENEIETTCEMGIVLKEENIDSLYDVITSDPKKLSARCESVVEHIDYINQIKSTGCQVLFV